MKAIDAVKNLRALADLLEKHGDADIWMTSATVWVEEKSAFLELAKDMPRPFRKEYEDGSYGYLKLLHGGLNKGTDIDVRIRRSNICALIEPARPAKYDCPSIFSPEEEAQLEQQG